MLFALRSASLCSRAPAEAGSMCLDRRRRLVSCVTFSAAQISTRSEKSAAAVDGMSTSAQSAAIAMLRLPRLPASGCEDPDAKRAVGDRMGEDRRPQVAASFVHPPVGDAGEEPGEPERMLGSEERRG